MPNFEEVFGTPKPVIAMVHLGALPGSPPGDFYVVLKMVNPPLESDAARTLYERMAREFEFDPRASMG